MALTKKTIIDRVDIDENLNIGIRTVKLIEEDGVRLEGGQYSRRVIPKNADVTNEPLLIRKIANAIWT